MLQQVRTNTTTAATKPSRSDIATAETRRYSSCKQTLPSQSGVTTAATKRCGSYDQISRQPRPSFTASASERYNSATKPWPHDQVLQHLRPNDATSAGILHHRDQKFQKLRQNIATAVTKPCPCDQMLQQSRPGIATAASEHCNSATEFYPRDQTSHQPRPNATTASIRHRDSRDWAVQRLRQTLQQHRYDHARLQKARIADTL